MKLQGNKFNVDDDNFEFAEVTDNKKHWLTIQGEALENKNKVYTTQEKLSNPELADDPSLLAQRDNLRVKFANQWFELNKKLDEQDKLIASAEAMKPNLMQVNNADNIASIVDVVQTVVLGGAGVFTAVGGLPVGSLIAPIAVPLGVGITLSSLIYSASRNVNLSRANKQLTVDYNKSLEREHETKVRALNAEKDVMESQKKLTEHEEAKALIEIKLESTQNQLSKLRKYLEED